MRILVTKQGNIIIQEIDDAMPLYTQNMNSTSKFRGYSTDYPLGRSKNFKMNSLSRTNNKLKRTPIRQIYRNLEDTEITKEEMQSAKQIKLNERKITFPKQFAEKYESDIMNSQNNNIINSSNNFLPSLTNNNMNSNLEKDFQTPLDSKRNNINNTSSNSFLKQEKYLSLMEIIPTPKIYQMKKKIIKDKKIRDKATVITENDFRTVYKPQTDLQKFNNLLKTSLVNSNKSNLIRYLNEKKIAPLTIKLLANQDVDKISKINKICQTIFSNQEKDKLFNEIVKNKAKQKINNTKKEFQNTITDLGSNMNEVKEKLKKYEKKIDEKEKYREYFNDIVIHHWLKRDLERFNKKSTPKPKYIETFADVNDEENSKK
jgi:hypothetical protein